MLQDGKFKPNFKLLGKVKVNKSYTYYGKNGKDKDDYLEDDWYRRAFAADSGYWSEPYMDDSGREVLQTTSPEPQTLIKQMTQAVADFVGDTEQSDDLTMLALQYL